MKKKTFFRIAVIVLMIIVKITKAQMVFSYSDNKKNILPADTIAEIQLFEAKYAQGKIYFHWNVVNQNSKGVYIIFRSYDEKNYEILGSINGFGVSTCEPIAYYFQDERPCAGKTYYKLMHWGNNKTYLQSEPLAIKIDQLVEDQKMLSLSSNHIKK